MALYGKYLHFRILEFPLTGSKASITVAWQDKPEAPSPGGTSDEEDSGVDMMVMMISMTLVMTGVLENTLW